MGLEPGIRDRLSAEGVTVVLGVDFQQMINGTSNFMLAFPASQRKREARWDSPMVRSA